MQTLKEVQNPVQWHEGMLLAPQHFQQEQRYQENQRAHELLLGSPNHWGVAEFDYVENDLLGGVLNVRKIYGIMPDGLVAHFESGPQQSLKLEFGDVPDLKKPGSCALLHLVVPIRTEEAARQDASIQRFKSKAGTVVVDENTGRNEVQVHRLSPCFSLWVGAEPPDRFYSIPLLEVRRSNDGSFSSTDFVPPLRLFNSPNIGTASGLYTKCERLVQGVRQKANQLTGIALSDSTGLSLGGRRAKYKSAARLGSVLPQLEAVLYSSVHPACAHRAFCEAVGKLAQMTRQVVPPRLGDYKHDDINGSFSSIVTFFTLLLTSIKTDFNLTCFDLQDSVFFTKLVSNTKNKVITVEFRGKEGVSKDTLLKYVQSARIATISSYDRATKGRLLGAERTILEKPLYELDVDDNQPRVVVHLSVNDPYIVLGETLKVTSTNANQQNQLPDSVWLYSSN